MATAFATQHLEQDFLEQEYENQLSADCFEDDVISGLSKARKSLSPKYFYDEQGSHFFDQICDLEEYYPYKTELKLLPVVAEELSEILTGSYAVIEFGAGSLHKIRPLFENINGIKRFVPIDISGEFLKASVKHLQKGFPKIKMQAVAADFSKPVQLPSEVREEKIGFFPGSTIGNFTPDQACEFLSNALQTLGQSGYMLIGVDTKKSPITLHKAYNDSLGVTKKFNLNVLERINRELDADINTENFEHYAFYNADKGCIEMHLVSKVEQCANVSGKQIAFKCGESIHTESSYKYTAKEFSELAQRAGWKVEKQWLAEGDMFSTFLLSPQS